MKTCITCKKEFHVPPSLSKRIKNCSMRCHSIWQSKNRVGSVGGNWRGGKTKKICSVCKKHFFVFPHAESRRKTCSKECQKTYQSDVYCGPNHPNWKGGKHIAPNGYVIISVRGKSIYEHRFLMEKSIGRKLLRREHLHHKNGVKTDNRLSNLEIVTPSDHKKMKHSDVGVMTRFKK
jgi:hypothetical protein